MKLQLKTARGFTLIELVVVIIVLGILAAIAVPQFIDLSRNARIASVNAMAGAVQTAAEHMHAACLATPDCRGQMGAASFTYTFDGQPAQLQYGWPDAGDALAAGQIDSWIVISGFTAILVTTARTKFTLDGAPDPFTCGVTYSDPSGLGQPKYLVATVTTGC